MKEKYDLIVVGGGHAGIEAALASARMKCKTLLLTMNIDRLGFMSCNPAIGGLAKGHLVKEIDALGGEMAKATDFAGIQFRILNSSKGPAVRSSRAQVDRKTYIAYMRGVLEREKNIFLRQTQVTKIMVKNRIFKGVEDESGERFFGASAIIAPGTFLNGLIHIGFVHFSGGRLGDRSATDLSGNLKKLGFEIQSFKTGTCARLDARSIDFSKLKPQAGDLPPHPFSFSTPRINRPQVPCYITYTNPRTHKIIRNGLKYSPLYQGIIKSTGVRYCPSIEDKIVKFPQRSRHHIFLEPEGLNTVEVYPNGISTSLPLNVQYEMIHSIVGLERAHIIRPGYGIEHEYVNPLQLMPTLETKLIKNLYFAGQINGTTGYEEAAAQGLVAGINAALKIKKKPALILERWQAYTGVLIDDLISKGTNEPYRMFTSRAEHRLILREDNADLRLTPLGHRVGLIPEERYRQVEGKRLKIKELLRHLEKWIIKPTPGFNRELKACRTSPLKEPVKAIELLRRPQIDYQRLDKYLKIKNNFSPAVKFQVEVETKYAGYIKRQDIEIARLKKLQRIKIPSNIDFQKIKGLSNEVKEKLNKVRPINLAQAVRISGVTPAAISLFLVYLKKERGRIRGFKSKCLS